MEDDHGPARCALCEENRIRLGLPAQSEPPPRVQVGTGWICPAHDTAGSVMNMPERVRIAAGYE